MVNARVLNRWTIFSALVLVLLALSSCRRQQATQQVVVRPSDTATPLSTPLPPLATAVPVGTEANPLQMVIRPAESLAVARNVAARFQTAIENESGLVVEVVLVERYAEALAALCNSASGQVAVAWLDGLTYMASTADNCGAPALQVERGAGRNATTGQAVQIIANHDREIGAIAQLAGDKFCRLGYEDFSSWLVPSLLFAASGVDPLSDLESVTDFDELNDLIAAVADGDDCDATGVPAGTLDDMDDVRDEIDVVETTVEFPYGILMFPIEVPLGTRLALTDTLIAIADDPDDAETMQPLLGQDSLVRADSDDFTELRSFLNSTGLDFAHLGS